MSSTSRSQGDRTRVADGRQKGRPVDGPASNSQTKQGYSSVADNAREPAANGGSYRILLLGKSGVGKSSLIQTILKVPGIDASHYNRGTSDINKEYKSSEYPQFILHDSMGFEFGDLEETKTVKNFIKNRSEDKEVSEQVQAIWLCIMVPIAGGRLFEMCDETLFDPDLKRVPIIIVFTQYDELVDRKIMELIEAGGEGIDQEELYRKAAPSAESDFDSLCIQPLKKLCKLMKKESIPPNIRVSVRSRYEDTLTQLIHLTKSTVLHRPDPIRP